MSPSLFLLICLLCTPLSLHLCLISLYVCLSLSASLSVSLSLSLPCYEMKKTKTFRTRWTPRRRCSRSSSKFPSRPASLPSCSGWSTRAASWRTTRAPLPATVSPAPPVRTNHADQTMISALSSFPRVLVISLAGPRVQARLCPDRLRGDDARDWVLMPVVYVNSSSTINRWYSYCFLVSLFCLCEMRGYWGEAHDRQEGYMKDIGSWYTWDRIYFMKVIWSYRQFYSILLDCIYSAVSTSAPTGFADTMLGRSVGRQQERSANQLRRRTQLFYAGA